MTDEIKLLEAIKDTLQTGVEAIVGQIGKGNARLEAKLDETNARLTSVGVELGDRIDETNARLTSVGVELGTRIDETNARLTSVRVELGDRIDKTNDKLDSIDTRLGITEHLLDQTNDKLDRVVTMFTEANRALNVRGAEYNERITNLEHRVDKLEEAS